MLESENKCTHCSACFKQQGLSEIFFIKYPFFYIINCNLLVSMYFSENAVNARIFKLQLIYSMLIKLQ